MSASAIRIEGLAEFQKTLKVCEREVRLGVRAKLKDAAEPVRVEAEHLAAAEIRNIGHDWSQMRVGITTSLLYVAPKQRGAKSGGRKRGNMFGLLSRALNEALDAKAPEVERLLEGALDDILHRNW